MKSIFVNSIKMIKNRVPVKHEVDPSILRGQLKLGPSGRVVKNRLLKSALSDNLASYSHKNSQRTGIPSQQLINVYDKFGHGGFGLLITGNTSVDPEHFECAGNMLLCPENESNERRKGFEQLAKIGKQEGSLLLIQLAHPGNLTPAVINPNPCLVSGSDGHVLDEDEIEEKVVKRFVYAAEQTHKYGFDGVQIHAAYINLVAQFISSKDNKRKDKYGGSLTNRLRIVEEIFHGIRQKLPASTGFIIGIKLDSVLMNNKSKEADEFAEMVKKLDEWGFDFVEIAGSYYEKIEGQIVKFLRPYIKQSRIYLTGGFRQTETIVRAIEKGDADGVGLGRSVTAEPDVAHKLLSNKIQSVPLAYYDHDWETMIQMSVVQMGQASQTSWSEANQNALHGISDFSDKKEADNFHEKLKEHMNKNLNK